MKWRVRCKTEGAVWLAMWRWENKPSTVKLIGKHRIEVTAAMVDQIVVIPTILLFGLHHKFTAVFSITNVKRCNKVIGKTGFALMQSPQHDAKFPINFTL